MVGVGSGSGVGVGVGVGAGTALHCAKRVKLLSCPCVYGNVIGLPPLAAVNQPLKLKPDCVGVPGDVVICPPDTVVPLVIALPPWTLYVTVRLSPSHCANSVVETAKS